MAPSGGRHGSNLSERQLVGLFSLGLGVVLFALILVRGQQAAREGNQEIRNDTYWVLVSPLVFSAFGVALLRAPKGGTAARASRRGVQPVVMRPQVSRALDLSERSTRSAQASLASTDAATAQQLSQARAEAASALASVQALEGERDRLAAEATARISALEQELVQVQQARADLEADLRRTIVTQSSDASGAMAAVQLVEGQVDQLAGGLHDQMAGARQQLDQLIVSQEEQLGRLRAEASQARSRLDQLSAEQDVELARVRAEGTKAVHVSLQALRAEREQAVSEAKSRINSVEADLTQLHQSYGQLEQDLRCSILSPTSEGTVPMAAVSAVGGQVDQLAVGLEEQLRRARYQIDHLMATQEDQFSQLRAEAAEAKTGLEKLRTDHEAQMVRLRAEADAMVQSSLRVLDGERGRLAEEASARIGSLGQELYRVRQVCDQLETELRQSLLSPTADHEAPKALVQQVEGKVTLLAADLRDQLGRAQLLLDPLVVSQEEQLGRLRADAQQARAQLDQLSADQDGQLARVRAEATAAIRAAQAAQAQSQAVAEGVSQQMATMDQQIQQAQQSCTRVAATLRAAVASTGQVQAEAVASAAQAQHRVEELAGSLSAQMNQARKQLSDAVKASEEAQALVERLEQGAFSVAVASAAPATGDPLLSSYREACDELGVLPGSPWQEVRATWRRNLMHWHPDQGGDPRLWVRRNAAYQLLVAWYDFNGAS